MFAPITYSAGVILRMNTRVQLSSLSKTEAQKRAGLLHRKRAREQFSMVGYQFRRVCRAWIALQRHATYPEMMGAAHDFGRVPVQNQTPQRGGKLAITQPGDACEIRAERFAKKVVGPADASIGSSPANVFEPQKKERCKRTQGTVEPGTDEVPSSVHEALRSPGRPLDEAARADFEPRFGADFSRVRVHTDSAAERSAQEVHAPAYTVGQNLVFASGQFAPGTDEGRRLLHMS